MIRLDKNIREVQDVVDLYKLPGNFLKKLVLDIQIKVWYAL
jgi:hypothetical protein